MTRGRASDTWNVGNISVRMIPLVDSHYLINHSSDAAFVIDGGLEIVAWNQAAHQLLGFTSDEVIGQHCSDIIQANLPDGEPLCVPSCDGIQCFRREKPFAAHACVARHKDGRQVPISIASVTIPKKDRQLHADAGIAVVFLRDLEEKPDRLSLSHTLQIFTFGSFGLAVGGQSIALVKWERKQAITLLKYLVAHLGRPVHRETLMDILWPNIDESRGWKRLKVTIHSLRHELHAAGLPEDIVETANETYTLRGDAVWVDSSIFVSSIAEGKALQNQQQWENALKQYTEAQHLYRGDYLEEDIYADWCMVKREQLREIYLSMLASMADCHGELGHYAEAAQVCRTALVCDPGRESFHRALMDHLVHLGRADWAIAEYQKCQKFLDRELGMEPMPETVRLYQHILEKHGGKQVG